MGFGSEEEWIRFNKDFPVFVEKYAALEELRDKIFQRGGVGDKLDRLVFGLGRVCAEDFQQALVLGGNGFGIGALQIVRGMYERLVTTAFLIKQPDKVADFIDYHCVQERKSLNILREIYNGDDLLKMIPQERQDEIQHNYEEVTKNGRFSEPVCKHTDKRKPLSSWINIAMAGLALKAERGLSDMYFNYYNRPTMMSHSTVASVLARLREGDDGNPMFDNEGQKRVVKEAVTAAHHLLLLVLDLQNDHFKLKLDEELKQLTKDYRDCWALNVPDPPEPEVKVERATPAEAQSLSSEDKSQSC